MTLANERPQSASAVQKRSTAAGCRATAKHRLAPVAGILSLVAVLAGCVAVPLTAANAPLAAAFWIPVLIAILDEKTAESEALLLGEVRQRLTPDAVVAGHLDPDGDRLEDLPGLLAALGITERQVRRGHVLVLRVGLRTSEGSSAPRGIYLPVLRADVAVDAGNIVEFRLHRERPPELFRLRAADINAGECAFRDIPPTADPLGHVQGRELGHQMLSATLYCRGIEAEGWQQPAAFWRKPLGPPTGDLATLLVFSARRKPESLEGSLASAPSPREGIWISVDSSRIFEFGDQGCNTVFVPPGEHVVTADSEFGHRILRHLRVTLKADERVAVRFVFDEKKYLESTSFTDPEVAPEFLQATALPATASDVCRLGQAPMILRRRQ